MNRLNCAWQAVFPDFRRLEVDDVEWRDPAFEERKVKVLEDYAAAGMLRQIPGGQPPGCRALLR